MTEAQLKLYYGKRDAMFARIQTIADRTNDLSREVTKETFLDEIETIDKLRTNFENVLDKINSLELELNPKFVVSYQALDSFDGLFGRIKRASRSLLAPAPNVKSTQIRDPPRLPPIQIPDFDGDIKAWPIFYANFQTMVHNNPSLTDSEKLYYLIGKLSGKARTVCAGINPTAENYTLLLDTLISKFEDKRLLATSYLDQIFDLKPLTSASSNNLELFLDKFATSVSALRNLKLDSLDDFLFLYLALKRLDQETARAFEMDNRGTDIPSFNSLETFVRDHIKILQRTSSFGNQEATKKAAYRRSEVASKSDKPTHTYVNTATSSKESNLQSSCSLCDSEHDHLFKCQGFQKLTSNERYNFVKISNLCINCLGKGHRVSACGSNGRCHKCQNKHHTMLHFENNNATSLAVAAPPSANLPTGDVALCTFNNSVSRVPSIDTTVLLATARVIIIDAHGKEHSVRALLDSASQSNFITRECCNRLKFNTHKASCTVVKGIGGSSKNIQGSTDIRFFSRFDRNTYFDMESLIVDKVTESLPTISVDTSTLVNFNNLPLADDTYAVPGNIEMLIGASIFPHLLLTGRVPDSSDRASPSPCALETVLGYVIVGSAPALFDTHFTFSFCCAVEPIESVVRKFWELEEVSVPTILSPDDKECEEFYIRTTTRDEDGRYTVALPFKGDVQALGDSRRNAERRFLCLERKMQHSPNLKRAYDDVITEYLNKGYISVAPPETDETRELPSYIIPHHGVIREDKVTSKLRVVLDGSASTSTSVSLNDILYNGQNLQGNLYQILINFRLFRVALSADIRQMFLCIGIRECDRRFQRILFRYSPQDSIQVYQFNRVCFGLKSSPFHALRTIKQLASDEGDSYPKAKGTVETGLYMDDFVYCMDNEDEAIETASEVISLMKAGQFDLIKWTSNSATVLEAIPPSHRLSSIKEFDDSDSHKVLGLCWSPATDSFSLKICTPSEKCTKRTILSCVARLWDILGFVAPVGLHAKLLIKELWISNCDWDDTPPDSIVKLWTRFREELPLLELLVIPRHVGITKGSVVNIIGFADASERAYGAVVYFHVQNGNDISVSLISAKSKVSPRKVVSLARLELCAALLLALLINTVIDACGNRHPIDNIYAFSDSTVALCWINSSPHRWGTFVANRVAKIQSLLSSHNFYHISGSTNPADCLSRGLTPKQIIDHPLWFQGPSWTKLKPSQWPIIAFNPSTVSEPPEQKRQVFVISAPNEESPIITLANRVASWSKLLRCVVYVCRFMRVLPLRDHITAADFDHAEQLVLRALQAAHFPNELANLQAGKLCSSRAFQRLKPFLHEGLIRVGGRLVHSELNFDQRHPIVLPRKDHVLNLLVDYHHRVNCHAGPDLLMSVLRQNYWILSARNLIRSRVHKCLPCFRLRPKPTFPEMSDHKGCRVVQSAKCFVHTGTDYAGPFRVTVSRGRGIRATKAYVCLFVCMTTRAVHIELAGDLSTACFMAAFKRFISRRGPVGRMYSDNGTNYIGAKRMLSDLHSFLSSQHFNSEFGHILAENRIGWSLNTPTASHFGGNWEANVKSLKTHLYRVVGDQILSFEELSTILAQIEAVMNTRPLCRTLSSDPAEPLALTPAHFLTLTPLKYFPSKEIHEDRLHLLPRHDLLDKLVQSFWKRWRTEYLHTLQSREKWNTPVNPVTVGTVVILTAENAPPLHWPLGIVEEVFPGVDGVTRVVRVKTATGSYLRPVVRLCPLPNQ